MKANFIKTVKPTRHYSATQAERLTKEKDVKMSRSQARSNKQFNRSNFE